MRLLHISWKRGKEFAVCPREGPRTRLVGSNLIQVTALTPFLAVPMQAESERKAGSIPLGPESDHYSIGAGVPSDQWPTQTIMIVTRSSGSFAAITGEPGS